MITLFLLFIINTASLLDIDNSNIAVSAVFEENEKKVNEVYLNTIAKGSFDYNPQQLSALEMVASQCPWEGGNAVFRARGMLALVQRVIINDESMCEAKSLTEEVYNKETTEEAQVEEEYISETGILLYPNPANDVLNLEWENPLESAHTIQILDINGRLLQQKEAATANSYLQLNTTNIPVGLYILRISDNAGNILANKKFVIVR
jgi:hypothetical protein